MNIVKIYWSLINERYADMRHHFNESEIYPYGLALFCPEKFSWQRWQSSVGGHSPLKQKLGGSCSPPPHVLVAKISLT